MLSESLAWVLRGTAFGLQFNPLASVVGSAGAAALVGYPSAPRSRGVWAALLLAGAWVLGDAITILSGIGRHLTSEVAVVSAAIVIVSFGVGYVVPAMAGAYVGRHVTHGTGWLSAIVVASLLAVALAQTAPTISEALMRGLTP